MLITLCTCFCTEQMLVDALVFGVYKCVSSLLNVSVLLLLELDFKRVYFIQTGRIDTTSGKCCCYVQVPFCLFFVSVKWSTQPDPGGRLDPQSQAECSKELRESNIINRCFIALKMQNSATSPTWPRTPLLPTGGGPARLTFQGSRCRMMDLWELHWRRERKGSYGYFLQSDWGCKGVEAGEREDRFGVFSLIVFLFLTKVLCNALFRRPWMGKGRGREPPPRPPPQRRFLINEG